MFRRSVLRQNGNVIRPIPYSAAKYKMKYFFQISILMNIFLGRSQLFIKGLWKMKRTYKEESMLNVIIRGNKKWSNVLSSQGSLVINIIGRNIILITLA